MVEYIKKFPVDSESNLDPLQLLFVQPLKQMLDQFLECKVGYWIGLNAQYFLSVEKAGQRHLSLHMLSILQIPFVHSEEPWLLGLMKGDHKEQFVHHAILVLPYSPLKTYGL